MTAVETQLQQLASARLAHGARDADTEPGSKRASRASRARTARSTGGEGAYDSPAGFVFVAGASGHHRRR
jgi:hypothetical protein